MLSRWRRLQHNGGEVGLTLIELLVTMFLLGLVLAVASSMFISVARVTSHTQVVNEGTRVAANAMDEINRVIRFAVHIPRSGCMNPFPAIRSGNTDSLEIISMVRGDDSDLVSMQPMRVIFQLGGDGNITERRWALRSSGGFWVDTNPVFQFDRTLGGRFLATGIETSLFRYLDAGGNELVPPNSAGLSNDQRLKVAAVLVTMNTVPLAQPDSEPVVIENTIFMLNLEEVKTGCT